MDRDTELGFPTLISLGELAKDEDSMTDVCLVGILRIENEVSPERPCPMLCPPINAPSSSLSDGSGVQRN